MAIGQEQVPESVEDTLKEFLARRFIDIGNALSIVERHLSDRLNIAQEIALMRNSVSFTGNQLVNYAEGFTPPADPVLRFPPAIAYDLVAGTVTVGIEGTYRLSGYVAQNNGTNNANYAMEILINGIPPSFPIGSGVWDQQAGGLVYNAAAAKHLLPGDVVTMHYIGANEPTVLLSQLAVQMLTKEDFI